MTASRRSFFFDDLLPQGAEQVGVGGGIVDGQTGDQLCLIVEDLGELFGFLRVGEPGLSKVRKAG